MKIKYYLKVLHGDDLINLRNDEEIVRSTTPLTFVLN